MGGYALFLGCYIPMRLPQIEVASRLALDELGVKTKDVEGFTCCPEPWNFKGTDLLAWLKVAGRNLAVAEKKKMDILTLCNGCSATLIEAAHLLSNGGEAAREAGESLSKAGYPYKGKTKAAHAVTVLDRELGAEKVAKSCSGNLDGLKVAVHYGCHLLRPSEVLDLDDPFEPRLLDGLVEATGAKSVDYDNKMECCGRASLDDKVSLGIAREKIRAMEAAGAHCVVVTCPACFEQFDLGQVQINRARKEKHALPVLHYFQLLALAQGREPGELALSRHKISVEPLLKAVKV
ncbi:MAG: heterodisulfide reductase-related iron-sulfur binding cluster [Actinomycetota bacterium]|nr:heterodisulfide reductase-related iron-sulfur binding cluster [Actinomycetota bacterium]